MLLIALVLLAQFANIFARDFGNIRNICSCPRASNLESIHDQLASHLWIFAGSIFVGTLSQSIFGYIQFEEIKFREIEFRTLGIPFSFVIYSRPGQGNCLSAPSQKQNTTIATFIFDTWRALRCETLGGFRFAAKVGLFQKCEPGL